jgi:hypothetical protein
MLGIPSYLVEYTKDDLMCRQLAGGEGKMEKMEVAGTRVGEGKSLMTV